MKQIKVYSNKTIINFKEHSSSFFIQSGTVWVYTVDERGNSCPFQYLKEGSAFNISNCILNHYSLFQIVAQTDCVLMQLDKQDIDEVAKTDFNIFQQLE